MEIQYSEMQDVSVKPGSQLFELLLKRVLELFREDLRLLKGRGGLLVGKRR